MAQLPILHTARATITPFTMDYITPAYISWLNDPQVVRYSRQRLHTHDRASCIAFFQEFENSPNHFSAIITEEHGHIGNISTLVDSNNQVADLSILIGMRIIWGQGYASEIWKAVMDALFLDKMRLVTGGCIAKNSGMIKVMKKAGMTPYYTRRNFFLLDGKPVDSIHYAAENKEQR